MLIFMLFVIGAVAVGVMRVAGYFGVTPVESGCALIFSAIVWAVHALQTVQQEQLEILAQTIDETLRDIHEKPEAY